MDMHDLTVHNCIQEQKVADTFLSSFDNAMTISVKNDF